MGVEDVVLFCGCCQHSPCMIQEVCELRAGCGSGSCSANTALAFLKVCACNGQFAPLLSAE